MTSPAPMLSLTWSTSMRNHISCVSELYLGAETMTCSLKSMQLVSATLICKYGTDNFLRIFL
jgi:hypothetical protein